MHDDQNEEKHLRTVQLFHLMYLTCLFILKVIVGPLAVPEILPHQGTGRNSLTVQPGDDGDRNQLTVVYKVRTNCNGRR